MNYLAFALTLLALGAAPLRAELIPDPAARAVGVVDIHTYRLYQSLNGSRWIYLWHGRSHDVVFGQGGTMATSPWPGATWRVLSENSVAIKTPIAGEMAVHLNAEFTKWNCKDWSGDKATGVRQNPNATVVR